LINFISRGFANPVGFTTCQGTNYENALLNCPDRGAQRFSSGGNVTILVRRAQNIPNSDFASGPSSGVSDPYVKFTAGDIKRSSSPRRDSLNPVWDEYVNIGVLGSGTEIKVEIWDEDSGIEFGDDLLLTDSVRVPFCSMFSAPTVTLDCGEPFGCSADDSAWLMPTRQQCRESGVIAFKGKDECTSSGICLYLTIFIVPAVLKAELVYDTNLYAPEIIAGPLASELGLAEPDAPWLRDFYPFADVKDSEHIFDPSFSTSRYLNGALMVQTLSTDSGVGKPETIHYYLSMNFDADIYICRPANDNELGIPLWIQEQYDDRNRTITQLVLQDGPDTVFGCFFRSQPATIKNKYGGVLANALPIYTNTVAGRTTGYSYNFVVLAIPRVIAPRGDSVIVIYEMSAFVQFLFFYGCIWMWFAYISMKFVAKLDYRIDRISSFLATRVLTGIVLCIMAYFLSLQSS
jgi:hypothetical protein